MIIKEKLENKIGGFRKRKKKVVQVRKWPKTVRSDYKMRPSADSRMIRILKIFSEPRKPKIRAIR